MVYGDKVFSFVSVELSASIFRVPELGSQSSPDPNHKYHNLSNIRHGSQKMLVDIKKTSAGIELWLRKVLYRLPIINVLKPSGYFVYHQVCYLRNLTFCPQTAAACFV
jgi:hypothetical protein